MTTKPMSAYIGRIDISDLQVRDFPALAAFFHVSGARYLSRWRYRRAAAS